MKYDLFSIVTLCGMCAATFWLIGFCMLLVAIRKARREFRVKGYLRTPSGTRWFRFLLFRQYDYFEDPGTRFYFGISHFCLLGTIIVLTAIVLLLGCDQVFDGMSGFSGGMMPDRTLLK
jgi:hypothetical protein